MCHVSTSYSSISHHITSCRWRDHSRWFRMVLLSSSLDLAGSFHRGFTCFFHFPPLFISSFSSSSSHSFLRILLIFFFTFILTVLVLVLVSSRDPLPRDIRRSRGVVELVVIGCVFPVSFLECASCFLCLCKYELHIDGFNCCILVFQMWLLLEIRSYLFVWWPLIVYVFRSNIQVLKLIFVNGQYYFILWLIAFSRQLFLSIWWFA